MDPIKFVVKAYKHVINYPREYPFLDKDVISREEGDSLIEKMLLDNKPCFIARYGVVELNAVEEKYYQERLIYRNDYTEDLKKRCLINAGIFPNDKKYLNRFARLYRKATRNVDVFAVWRNQPFEHFAIKKYSKCRTFIPLNAIYTGVNNWTRALEGKKVLVVNAFAKTMEKQYKKKEKLFLNNPKILPDMDLFLYKSVVSHGGLETPFENFEQALKKMYDDISKIDFDIALLGCGAYGLPLGNMIYKKMHKKVVHVGGSLQLLFGIKAKVYLSLEKDILERTINDDWVYPSDEEIPPRYKEIDEGCYWK